MADTHKRKANDWYFKLEAHPLVKRVMADLKPLLLVWGAQLMQQAKEGRLLAGAEKYANPLLIRQHRKQEEAYSDRLNYALDVFSYVSNLLTAVERFGGIRVYLARLPQPRRYEAVGVTEDPFIADDELVEITPKSIRLRKRHLKEHERRRAGREAA